jgi:hypothetical protein
MRFARFCERETHKHELDQTDAVHAPLGARTAAPA